MYVYTYLEIHLNGVVDVWCGEVELWHHVVYCEVMDGRLELGLLRIHQHPHTLTHSTLLTAIPISPITNRGLPLQCHQVSVRAYLAALSQWRRTVPPPIPRERERDS